MAEQPLKCPDCGADLVDPEMQRMLLDALSAPPALLVQMRLVVAGKAPAKGYEHLAKVYAEDFFKFRSAKAAEEAAYVEAQAKVLAARTNAEEADEDGDRVTELAENWLRERQGGT